MAVAEFWLLSPQVAAEFDYFWRRFVEGVISN